LVLLLPEEASCENATLIGVASNNATPVTNTIKSNDPPIIVIFNCNG
jgi:hypothetical protein